MGSDESFVEFHYTLERVTDPMGEVLFTIHHSPGFMSFKDHEREEVGRLKTCSPATVWLQAWGPMEETMQFVSDWIPGVITDSSLDASKSRL